MFWDQDYIHLFQKCTESLIILYTPLLLPPPSIVSPESWYLHSLFSKNDLIERIIKEKSFITIFTISIKFIVFNFFKILHYMIQTHWYLQYPLRFHYKYQLIEQVEHHRMLKRFILFIFNLLPEKIFDRELSSTKRIAASTSSNTLMLSSDAIKIW